MKGLLAFLMLCLLSAHAHAGDAFDRVMAQHKIRCSYLVYPPFIIKDLNTGKMSGVVYDVMEGIGKNAGLSVEWTEEVPQDSLSASLDAGRSDVFCVGTWANTARARSISFSVPMFYNAITAWGRVGDKRFSKNINLINDPSVTITAMDGTAEQAIAQTDFPQAKILALPASAQYTDNFVNIATKKADVSFFENSLVNDYVAKNPGTLERVSNTPLRIFGSTLVVKKGEYELKELLDQGVMELIYSGQMKKIVDKYEKYPGSFLLPSMPYESLK